MHSSCQSLHPCISVSQDGLCCASKQPHCHYHSEPLFPLCNLDTSVAFLRAKICMQSEQKHNVMCLVGVRLLSFSIFSELKYFAKYTFLPHTLTTLSLHFHSMLDFSHPPELLPLLSPMPEGFFP